MGCRLLRSPLPLSSPMSKSLCLADSRYLRRCRNSGTQPEDCRPAFGSSALAMIYSDSNIECLRAVRDEAGPLRPLPVAVFLSGRSTSAHDHYGCSKASVCRHDNRLHSPGCLCSIGRPGAGRCFCGFHPSFGAAGSEQIRSYLACRQSDRRTDCQNTVSYMPATCLRPMTW
jgi:hypothetical protein